MVGIFGGNDNQTRTIQLFTLDASLLQGAFNAQIAQKNASLLGKVTQNDAGRFGPDVVPPWQKPLSALNLPEKLGEHLSQSNLFTDTENGLRSNLDKTSEGLFRIWKGLKKMHELTIFAAEDKRADLVRGQLQSQFERYESELNEFVSAQQLKGVTVIAGPLESEAETESRIPRSSSEYEGKRLFSNISDEVAGLDTNTRFNINVVKSDNTVIDVAVDLADMGATPKSLAAISEHLNTQLEAAGVTSRFFTYGDAEGKFGLKVTRSILEEVTLSPVDAESAVYVAGTSGNNEFAKGSLRKFTDVGTAPVQNYDVKTEAVDGSSELLAVAKGSNGEIFTLGTTTGDIDGQLVGGEQDVFLTRYDAAGNEVWRRMVGATDTAEGYGLAVSDDGSIAISGRANAPLTSGSPDNGINSFVTLYDSSGEAQWTRNTGPQAVDAAFAVDFDAFGNVVVAGATAGPLSGETHQGGQDAYLQQLSVSTGAVLGQVQIGDAGDQTATAVAVRDGIAYIAGNDGSQGFIRSYDLGNLAGGAIMDTKLGADTASTRISSITFDDAGNLFVGGDTDDAGLTLNGSTTGQTSGTGGEPGGGDTGGGDTGGGDTGGGDTGSGDTGGGDTGGSHECTQLEILLGTCTQGGGTGGGDGGTGGGDGGSGGGDGGTGSGDGGTGGGDGGSGGGGTISLTHSGGTDGFVAQIDVSDASLGLTAYVGSTETDRVRDVKVASNGEIFVTGETEGDLHGNNLVGTRDGFITRIGADVSTTTFTGINGRADANSLVIDEAGDSVLTRLGIGHGNIGDVGSRTVAAASSVRPGTSFSIGVDDGPQRRITIEADDSIRWVAFEMNKVLGRDGLAEVKKDGDFEFIKITARDDSKISLRPGNVGFDALTGLGLRSGDIYGEDVEDDESVFALGFGGFVNVNDFEASEKARDHLNFALKEIEKAFDFLTEGEKDPLEKRRQEALLQQGPQFLQNQIANFQAALTRLGG